MKLKPCPFCGAVPKETQFEQIMVVGEIRHKSKCLLFDGDDFLIWPGDRNAWNKRVKEKGEK